MSRDQCSFSSTFNQRLSIWARSNKRIGSALTPGKNLFRFTDTPNDPRGATIHVDLDLLNQQYRSKFIEPDFPAYCTRLIKALENTIHFQLAADPEQYTIRYDFKWQKRVLVKHVVYVFGAMIF